LTHQPPDLRSGSPDERLLAALAHASALLSTAGLIVPLIIWLTQKERSRFVAVQSLQALVFQASFQLLWLLIFGCYFLFFMGTITSIMIFPENQIPIYPGMILPLHFSVMAVGLIGGLGFLVYAIFAAAEAYQGRNFRYPVIGRYVEKRLIS
jgi:uncharacterized protein